jgi:hypothetical protein
VLHILVRDENPAIRFAKLIEGANVWAGPPGGSASRLLARLTADAGLDASDFTLLDNPWTTAPDVHFLLGGLLDAGNIAELADFRLFSFRRPGDIPNGTPADAIALRHHDVRPFLLPAGIYPALADDAVLTLAVRSVLVARQGLDDEVIYEISAALYAHAQDIARDYPLVTRELDEDLRSVELMLPLHDGARRYLDRDGPGFIERYVELLALAFTIAVSLASGAVALYRRRTQARKDRVDHYYARLIDIREAMMERSNAELRREVLAVQREVLDLLIDERVAADAGFVAFVSLSNQMLDELADR